MKISLFFFIIWTLLILGCSSGNPIETPRNDLPQTTIFANTDILGAYELTINANSVTAEMSQKRSSSIGESWLISGKSFFDTFPCKDCFRIGGVGYDDGKLIVKFDIRHPFSKGNPAIPPSGKNRLDLDLFDPALVVVPRPLSLHHYNILDIDIPEYIIANPDGFTGEFSIALPYVLIVDDSKSEPPLRTFNKFEMGADKNFEVRFPMDAGDTLVFDLYLTFGYGFSAVLKDRLKPTYYNPEFNRKAAWKVKVIPPNGTNFPMPGNTWNDFDELTPYNVSVAVFDWQIDANVDTNLTYPTDIYASSQIDYISVEIPGMTNSPMRVDGDSFVSGTGMPDSPLVYTIPIANENLLSAGEYIGLVEVRDERKPLDFSAGRDYLIYSQDGINLNQYQISNYRTYQTFLATIIQGGHLNWAKSAGGKQTQSGWDVTTLSDNSTVLTGEYYTQTTFGKGESNQTILISAGNNDIFVARYNPDGTLEWAKSAGGARDDNGLGIATLSDNSIVVTGFFSDSATFGKDEPNETVLNSDGYQNFFITRYNPEGTLVWAKSVGETDYILGWGITSLSDNSIVVTGYFEDSATFGKGEINETVLTSSGVDDIFIARYKPDGTLLWVKSSCGVWTTYSYGITTLSENSTVVTGRFSDSVIFGKGELNETILTSAGNFDIFIAGYDSDGVLLWAKRAGGEEWDVGFGITTLSDDSTVVTGRFAETATFGPGEPNQKLMTSDGWFDVFIARYNSNGTLSWATHAGGLRGSEGYGITACADNSIIVAGKFDDSTTFGSGELRETTLISAGARDIFIARYNQNGTLLWVNSAGGVSEDISNGIAILSDDSTVMTGHFGYQATFGPDEKNETILSSIGGCDIFVARFAP